MNALVISQETVDGQLSACADGETGDFVIKGGTFKLVPGVGAVVSGETITKTGVKAKKDPAYDDEPEPLSPKGKMSPAAESVVNRKSKY